MNVLTVTQVNTYLKAVFNELPPIQNIYITGEISNFKHYYQSGHIYFTLKDASSQLKCVMFSSDNYKLKFRPENGMNVVCFGQVGVYERDGVYQLYVRDMQPKGVGELAVAYEQLKVKLEQEGLFDESNKKPIPHYPSKIGVITSNVGAAVEDIKNVLSRRYPLVEIIIVPTLVQGDAAPSDIVKSLAVLDSIGVDTIILGRGGGSIEDLWAFNSEMVARSVYNCRTPIISAVGHETDFTICDFVADMRAPTPSAAAELAVPDIMHELDMLDSKQSAMLYCINRRIEIEKSRLDNIADNSALGNKSAFFDNMQSSIDSKNEQISAALKKCIDSKDVEIQKYALMLNALSPLAVLGRGYSIVSKDNKILSNASDVSNGDRVNIRFDKGSAIAEIIEVE